jgi:hypothetical protein
MPKELPLVAFWQLLLISRPVCGLSIPIGARGSYLVFFISNFLFFISYFHFSLPAFAK